MQLIFQILAVLFLQLMSYSEITIDLAILNPKGLNLFAWDMWLIVILLSAFLVGGSILNKLKVIPLYSLIIYPVILILFSVIRDVSSIQIMLFSLLSCGIVLKINYQKVKEIELSKA
ncbi:hypothetical protein L3081_09520 [Colwellia sp. MSW7]|uniref:Uncharacterized protein n=1 Tax=Colwellia maritima TaxID=2912588 RepID=A0ABS9X078_9GAMM|nr:hypothetical protein [Colwellia maritima]MCI2283585.1 hypothetical protein [Colwellia maritima]